MRLACGKTRNYSVCWTRRGGRKLTRDAVLELIRTVVYKPRKINARLVAVTLTIFIKASITSK
jgi:hypothetical protein